MNEATFDRLLKYGIPMFFAVIFIVGGYGWYTYPDPKQSCQAYAEFHGYEWGWVDPWGCQVRHPQQESGEPGGRAR